MLLAAGPGFQQEHPVGTGSFVFKSFTDFTLFGVDFHITRIITMLLFGVLLISLFFVLAFRRPTLVPGKLQFAGEAVYDFVRNGIAREVIGPEAGIRFAPYLTTLFCFIFLMNLYEILPLAQVPVNSRIAFPAVLAVISLVLFNFIGIRKQGLFRYLKEIAFPPGVPLWIYPLLTPIELVSTLIVRPFTLAVRLFANMFAGHLLLLVFIGGALYMTGQGGFQIGFGAVAFIMSIVLTFFELLVIALQAYVFVTLTAVYVSGALAEEH